VKKVAIQGVKASFHDQAAKFFFTSLNGFPFEIELVECSSFLEVFEKMKIGLVDYAVVAIENALAGSILSNYSLLEKYRLKILGEVFLKIEMCLIGLPETEIESLKIIQSHPMAILQCQEFLSSLKKETVNVSIIEHEDTAGSIKEIKEKKLKDVAGIAGVLAAEVYGMKILKRGIETHSKNFTRFLVLCPEFVYKSSLEANKATIRFELPDIIGSLAKILSFFLKEEINVSKIQSLPVIGRPYQYAFHLDLEWEKKNEKQYYSCLKKLPKYVLNLMHFGDYKKGVRPIL